LIEAAVEVFAARGYDSVSLREIAGLVGISHTGLRHHFESKEELLLEVLAFWDAHSVDFRQITDVSGIEWLRATVDVVAKFARKPLLVRLFVVLSGEATAPGHPAHHYFVDRYRRSRQLAIDHLTAAKLEGKLRSDVNITEAVAVIYAVLDGLRVQWLLDPQHVNIVELYRGFLNKFLDTVYG
jgi:AcrR family transcriptional regulator